MTDEKLLDDKLVDDWKPEEVEWDVICFLKDGRSFYIPLGLPTEQVTIEKIAEFDAYIKTCHPERAICLPKNLTRVIGKVKDYSHSIPIPRVKT